MELTIGQIKAPISRELEQFEQMFRSSMKTTVPLLDTIMNYIVRRKGKQLRPMFVLYSARLFGEISARTYRGASMVELLHTATLVHDDVVDDSYLRRGLFSINALWKNKIAVLVGDFLLSKGLLLAVENKDFDLLEIVSNSVREMSEGELLQMEKSRLMNITEPVYFEIIRKKTASLIASCCQIGTASTGASSEAVEQMRIFGEKVGLAFQIRDDLFDFGDNKSGKPAGIDIKEKKLTLPVIYALSVSNSAEARQIRKLIRTGKNQDVKLREVLAFVEHYNGMDYSRQKMEELRTDAFQILHNLVPESEARMNMQNLINFVIERES